MYCYIIEAEKTTRREGPTLPLYEYQCLECGQVFEVLVQRVNSTTVPVCPQCRRDKVERLWSTFAAQTSGRGSCATTADGIG